MVLCHQSLTVYNTMLGRRIPHPPSTKFEDHDDNHPAKRIKTCESTDGEEFNSDYNDDCNQDSPHFEVPDSEDDYGSDGTTEIATLRPTELENALPAVKTDKEAIRDYESMRAGEVPEDLRSRLSQRRWTIGKSSIYVDAFNLALETVLEDEAHLFDEKEMRVFDNWRELTYEAQYL